jgi:predicted transcriptional regulator
MRSIDHDRETAVFHPFKPGMKKLFGELEAEVMEIVWRTPDRLITVREVLDELNKSKDYAYTTIMTVMSNLAKKGVLLVEKQGQAYSSRAAMDKENYTQTMVGKIIDQLLADFSEPVLSHFAKALEKGSLPENLAEKIKKAKEEEA